MSYFINNQQKLNEIIFAKRNKNYGAYVIRSDYGTTLFKSVVIMMFVSCSLFSVSYYLSNKKTPDPIKKSILPPIQDSIFLLEVDVQPQEKLHANIKQNQEKTDSKLNIVSFVTVIDSLQTESDFNDSLSEKTNSISSGEHGSGGTDTGSVNGTKKTGTLVLKHDSIHADFGVDTPPEFEGGLKALYAFISDHLTYPEIAASGGQEGTVHVKFVVDERGRVNQLSLLNTAGYGLDEEALRVVGLIPKFKSPAKIKGEPVKVYYHLPIKFRLR